MKFATLENALEEIFKRLKVPAAKWLKASTIIRRTDQR